MEVLGYKVSEKRITPSTAHVKTFRDFPEPEDRFIERFSELAALLYEALKGSGWNVKKKKRQNALLEDEAGQGRQDASSIPTLGCGH